MEYVKKNVYYAYHILNCFVANSMIIMIDIFFLFFSVTPMAPSLLPSIQKSIIKTNSILNVTCDSIHRGQNNVKYNFYYHRGSKSQDSNIYNIYTLTPVSMNYTCSVTVGGVESERSSPVEVNVTGMCVYNVFVFA